MDSRFSFIDREHVASAKVEQFLAYWQSKCVGDCPPPRSAIQPYDVPKLLPYLVLVDIEPAGMRIRYRLVGTHEVDANGSDFTGRYLDECDFTIAASLAECYRRLVMTRRPVFTTYEWHREDLRGARGSVGASETGFFPLSSDGIVVDGAISIADSDIRLHKRGASPVAGQGDAR